MFCPRLHVQVMVYCIACGLMLFYQVRMVPYYTAWINCFRAGLNGILAWVTLWLCILQWRVSVTSQPKIAASPKHMA